MAEVFQLVTFALVGLGLLAVLILIAGNGAVHAKLSDLEDGLSAGLGLQVEGSVPNDVLGFSWWVALYSLGLYIAIGISTYMDTLHHRSRLYIPLLAAGVSMATPVCHQAVVFARGHGDAGEFNARAETWVAGAIMLSVVTLAILLWLGAVESKAPEATANQESKAAYGNGPGHMPPVGTPGPAPAPEVALG